MQIRTKHFITLLLVALTLNSLSAFGKNSPKATNTNLNKIQTSNVYRPMDINNIFNYYGNNGDGSFNKFSANNEGFEFPIGSTVGTTMFEDGIVWTAYKNDTLYCGGSTYNHGLQPGKILTNGAVGSLPTADDPNKTEYRVYRVRPDIQPTTDASKIAAETELLQNEVKYLSRYESYSANDLLQQHWKDWNEWPASDGAPFTDASGVAHPSGGSGYDPATCTPGFPGADQTEWMVMNDVNRALTQSVYGSNPIGIEVQRIVWAYNTAGGLGNTIFISYKLINKSGVKLDSMYISQWSDPDVGAAGDDAVGCDTTLNLGYVYNGQAADDNYAGLGLPPPAVGFDLLQGPMVTGTANDTATFDMKKIAGKKNLPMTSFSFFSSSNTTFLDPSLNDPRGTPEWYNLMRGLVSTTGLSFPSSVTNGSKYCYPGDPVTNTGPTYIGAAAVASPGDVRMCMNSGPFTMAPGDTQQIVIAEVAGLGEDHLHSVYTIKKYGYNARLAYNNMFKVTKAPSPTAPITSITNDSNAIQLQWENTAESFNQAGFTFQGYNVYQLSPEKSKLIATYDKIDGVTSVYGEEYDPATGQATLQQQQYGTDSGLQYNFTATKDYINNTSFIKGKKYYYAVTAYSYNPGTNINPNNTESYFTTVSAAYNSSLPGPNYGNQVQVTHTAGQSDAAVTVTIADPSKLTDHQYQVSFHDELFTLGSDGKWVDQTALSKSRKFNKTSDLTGSSLTSTAVWSEKAGSFDIHYLVDVASPNYDYCDGIQIKLPAGVTIDTAYEPVSNNTGTPIPFTLDRSTNTLFYSTISKDSLTSGDTTNRSTNGVFAGGEDIVVRVHGSLPIVTHYTMYDDNYGDNNGYYKGLVDVSGTDTLNTIANQFVTQHQWNVTDLTGGNIVLQNQTIYSGLDIYSPNYFFVNNKIYGPGGSSGSMFAEVGTTADQIFDGMTVDVNGSFTYPATIGKLIINSTSFTGRLGGEYITPDRRFDMADFTIFGWGDATAKITSPIYGGAGGTTSLEALQQDYELRWTGVVGDTIINGDTVVITKSGGSIATIFGASNYQLKNHPLNPNPGSTNPFTIRIPFEVWNTDKNEQVNLLVYDRNAAKTNDPTKNGFQVWNTRDRVYTWVVNTKQVTSVISPTSQTVPDSATWNWVFFKSQFITGDDIKIIYNNPIQIGKDTYTFNSSDVLNVKQQPIPSSFSLSQNYPNRFNPSTTIRYELPAISKVTIKIYNVLGQEVRTLVNQVQTAGRQSAIWDSRNSTGVTVSTGVYFYRIEVSALSDKGNSFSSVKKMLLLK